MHFFDGGCERQKENNVSLCAILVAEKDEDENVFGTNTAAAGNPSEIYVSMYGIFFWRFHFLLFCEKCNLCFGVIDEQFNSIFSPLIRERETILEICSVVEDSALLS